MKKKTKIFAAFFAAALLLFTAACSGNQDNGITTTAVPETIGTTSAGLWDDFGTSPATDSVPADSPLTVSDEYKPGSTQNQTAAAVPTTHAAPSASAKPSTAAPSASAKPSTAAPSSAVRPTAPPATTAPATTVPSTAAPSANTVRVTIKEGQTLTQIFKTLESKGVASFDALMSTAQTYDYSYYPLVASIPSNSNRCFKLEGYLFPDTYEFYVGEKPQDAIGRFLRDGKVKITDAMRSRASELGYSIDEVLTVASIIQKEGSNPAEVAKVAAVIYNRLKAGQKLQMDSTINYIERDVKPYLTGDINRYNSSYNTYKCSALPAGPICNPGLSTINAALYPADVPYLYFCHDSNANYYYATTFEEHTANLKLAGMK